MNKKYLIVSISLLALMLVIYAYHHFSKPQLFEEGDDVPPGYAGFGMIDNNRAMPIEEAKDRPLELKKSDESDVSPLIESENDSTVTYSLTAEKEFAQLDCSKRSGVFKDCSSDCENETEAVCTTVCRMSCVVKPGKDYESQDLRISLRLPDGFERQSESPLSYVLRGAEQASGTEFFDGASITLERLSLRGAALRAIVDLDLQEAASVGDIVAPVTETLVAGQSAWTFRVNNSGEMDYLYLDAKDGDYLRITTMAPDPQRRGYAAMLSDLLNSLRFID